MVPGSASSGSAWLGDYEHRRQHDFTGSTVPFGDQTDYQMNISVYYEPVIASNGIFEWFNKPASIHYEGTYNRTYLTWISTDGKIEIRYYDHDTQLLSSEYEVDDLDMFFRGLDDHNAPTMYIDPNGYISIFYTVHDLPAPDGDVMKKRSSNPEDISSWDARQQIDSDRANYPICRALENNTLWLFYRKGSASNSDWVYRVSLDAGLTWTGETTFIDPGANIGAYLFADTRGDEIHTSYNFRETNGSRTDVFYAYSDDGGENWKKRDGSALSLPLGYLGGDLVFDSAQDVQVWNWDIVIDEDYNPHITFVHRHNPNHELRYARYLGGWETYVVTTSETWYSGQEPITEPQAFYSGGIILDREDCTTVYLSNDHDVLELEEWRTLDDGETWYFSESITTDSTYNNTRPQIVWGYTEDLKLLWVNGRFDGKEYIQGFWQWTDWDTRILSYPFVEMGIGNEIALNRQCQDDFDDIRFTESDGETEIVYGFTDINIGDFVQVWVKIPSLPGNITTTMFMYYGLSSGSTTSDPDSTFLFWDDFEKGNLNEWTVNAINGTVQIDASNPLRGVYSCRINQSNDNQDNVMMHTGSVWGNVSIGGLLWLDDTVDYGGFGLIGRWDGLRGAGGDILRPNNAYSVCLSSRDDVSIIREYVTGTANVLDTFTPNWGIDEQKTFQIDFSNYITALTSNARGRYDLLYPYTTDNTLSSGYYGIQVIEANILIDNIYVRKCVIAPPTHGMWYLQTDQDFGFWFLEYIDLWIGLIGLSLVVGSPTYLIYKAKNDDWEEGLTWGLVAFVLGSALIISWLWS